MSQHHHYKGLTHKQVEQSRRKHGANTLTPPPRQSLWSQFAEKLHDPIIIILLIALALSVGVAVYQFSAGLEDGIVFLEPVGILISVILATVVGFAFEVSANRKFEILNKVNEEIMYKVIRDGKITECLKCDIVVGDIVILNTGEQIPADCTLLEATSLQVNESTLTGEPVIKKSTNPEHFSNEATYPTNHIMHGTSIVEGHAIGEVTAVSDATEYGKVYQGTQIDSSIKTPLNIQLDSLAQLITKGSYIVAVAIFVGRTTQYFIEMGGFDWIDFGGFLLNTLMIAITVIVVAVPEGLPMSVTLSLALSMKRMLSTNNLVRKMHACETMGATTVICTDKTGTLTQNQMRVFETKFYNLKDQELSNDIIRESIATNSTAYLKQEENTLKVLGNPTEGALLLWLHDNGDDYLAIRESCTTIAQLPFSTERKYMATIVDSPRLGKKILYVKGAPEIVMQMCDNIEQMTPQITTQLTEYQNMAMRTLGFAYHIIEEEREYISNNTLANTPLTFLGITAISDPIRKEVPQAIEECKEAAIEIKIVTGDTPATAKEIGRQIGLWGENESDEAHISGPEFAAMSDSEALEKVGALKILSRARPMDKQRLVGLLQSLDYVVAVTGDGTNDAPALKAAQVGLSMGDGTSVAKEASDITILDNSFSSISRAVMWGRSLYQNIQRFLLFQLTINVAACLIVLIGSFTGTESPLTVTQMLWVNLIMDTLAALALASLPPDKQVMKSRPRRRGEHIISRPIGKRIISVGLIFVAFIFGLMQYFKHATVSSLHDFSIVDYFHNYFNFNHTEGIDSYELSLLFTTFVMLQFWNIFNAKAFATNHSTFHKLSEQHTFLATAAGILIGQILIVTFGGEMFQVEPLKLNDWLIIIFGTSSVMIVGEIYRAIRGYKKTTTI